MCLAAAVGLAGAAVSAAGAMEAGKGADAQAQYNAKVAEINANQARQQGHSEADRVEDKYQRMSAAQRVGAAKAGLDPSAGSAALVLQETARNSDLDQLTSIWNRETEAVGFGNKAKDLRIQGQNAKLAGKYKATASFLSGLGDAIKTASGGGGTGSSMMISG